MHRYLYIFVKRTKLDDVKRVGTGDAIQLHNMLTDSSILSCVHILIAQLYENTTVPATGNIVGFEVADESRLLHRETAGHYIQSKVSYLIRNGVL